MSDRKLPPHVAAALRGAGGPADSADQPWAGRDLSGTATVHQHPDDDGTADSALLQALGELATGSGSEAEVVATMAGARLFVPIVAEVAAAGAGQQGLATDKESDMALVTLQAPDGRRALPVFSSVPHLQAWHPQARPVAVAAPRAALSAAAEEAQLMVLDPGAEQTFVVRRPAVWSLAQQLPWTPSYLDQEVLQAIAAAARDLTPVHSVQVDPGSGVASLLADGTRVSGGGAGPELCITALLAPGLNRDQVQAVVADLQDRLGSSQEIADRVDSLEIRLANAGDG